MKIIAWIAALLGAAVLIGLVIHEGIGEVTATLAIAGWSLLWLVPAHALPLLLDVLGWRALLSSADPQRHANLGFLYWVATIREAINRLLPSANVGGEIVGIRLVRLRVPDTAAVAASVIFEVLLTLVNQYLFVVLGVVLFAQLAAPGVNGLVALLALLFTLIPLGFLVWVLRHGAPFARIEALARRLLGKDSRFLVKVDGTRLDAQIRALYGQPRVLLIALTWQLSGYLLGAGETWLCLMLLGKPVGIGAALAIEALTQAARLILFMVPAGLGVQEASVVVFAGFAGVSGNIGLALALARRLRELVFGLPALLSWHWYESQLLRRAYKATQVERAPRPG